MTAEAAVPARSAAADPSWHWSGYYATQAECQAAGQATGAQKFTCQFFVFDTLIRGWILNTWY
ncbi:hypothetical protein GCM10010302_07680 [Streptomyces polychromogenes]|uniref:Uncharacterized protein n=1 Tax=Streptomyces polychromogenes TaxID=67342 RepID=A0ABP3EPA9_9ACTN